MSLRAKLLLALTLLLAVSLGGNYVLLVVQARRTLHQESAAKAMGIAELLYAVGAFVRPLEQKAEDIIGGQMIVQAELAAHLVDIAERAGMTPEQINARLRQVSERTVLDEFWITDASGHAYLRNREEIDFTFPSEPTELGQGHEFWPLLSQEHGQVVQDTMPREFDGRPFKYAAVSGVDGPRIVQVGYEARSIRELVAGMSIDDMSARLTDMGDLLAVQVADAHGRVHADWPDRREPDRPVSIRTELFLPQVKETVQTGRTVTRLHGDVLTVVRQIPPTPEHEGAAFLVAFDASATNAATRRARRRLGVVSLIVLLSGALVALRISRGIAEPIGALAEEAHQIGQGDLQRRVAVRGAREVQVLADALNRMTDSLADHVERLQLTTAAKERLEKEMEIAAQVQQAMLPGEMPAWSGLEVFACSHPARVVGGDFYDLLPAGEESLLFAVGDVSGKGLPAALLASHTQSIGRTLAGETPADVLHRTNAVVLHAAEKRGMFVTLLCGSYDHRRRMATLASAGHLPAVLVRSGAQPCVLSDVGAFPLGLLPQLEATEQEIPLQAGDLLLLYTDGVTEAQNAAGEMFGLDRLTRCLADCSGRGAREVVECVREHVLNFEGGLEPSDDLTLLALRVTA